MTIPGYFRNRTELLEPFCNQGVSKFGMKLVSYDIISVPCPYLAVWHANPGIITSIIMLSCNSQSDSGVKHSPYQLIQKSISAIRYTHV